MTSDPSALALIGFIKPLSSHSDSPNWLLAATNIIGEMDWLALVEGRETRPSSSIDFESATASTSSSSPGDSKMLESQQTWDTKATRVHVLLRRMLVADDQEMYSTECDPATVWNMQKE